MTNTVAPTNVITKIAYDDVGNVVSTTDARGNIISNNWSATANLLATILPATPQGVPVFTNTYDNRDWLAQTADPLQDTTLYTNDAAGRPLSVTDPVLRTTAFSFDADGRELASVNYANETNSQTWDARGDLMALIDGAGRTSLRTYDGAGNQITLTNRNGKLWRFLFDGANRLTNTITPLGRSTSLIFNHQGLVTTIKDPASQTTTYGYDAQSRLTSRSDSVGTTTYGYDANNNRTNVVENRNTNSWALDAYNRVSSYRDVYGNLIRYRYDAVGNLTNLIYPGGKNVFYAYDSLNRLTNVTDWAERQTALTYDLAGHLKSITRPNGTVRLMNYDAADELTNITERTAGGTTIASFKLGWNNAARAQWEYAAPLPHNNPVPTRTMTYNDDNELATVDGNSVTLDLDGNLTSGPLTNDTFASYVYDARNRLSSAGGVTNIYDALNNRIGQTQGTNNTVYVVSPNTPLSSVLMRIRNGVTNYYVYGAGLLYQVTETAGATNTLTYHYDYRGSTVALSDDSGNVTERLEYSLYATTTYRTGTNDTPFLFNGQYGVQTDANGLLYMRARYYNPYLCRFINADPSGFGGGMNFYAYVNGNPVSLIDPFGLAWFNSLAAWGRSWVASEQAYHNNHDPVVVATAEDTISTLIGGILSTPETISHLGKPEGTWYEDPTWANAAPVFGDVSLTASILVPVAGIGDDALLNSARPAVNDEPVVQQLEQQQQTGPPTRNYEPNDKHPPAGSIAPGDGDVAPQPTNPQEALDNAVSFNPNSNGLVSVDPQSGEFVVFRQHGDNTYHGYAVTWDQLTQPQKNALINSGKVGVSGNIK